MNKRSLKPNLPRQLAQLQFKKGIEMITPSVFFFLANIFCCCFSTPFIIKFYSTVSFIN